MSFCWLGFVFCSPANIKLLSIISIGPEALSERLKQKLMKANGLQRTNKKIRKLRSLLCPIISFFSLRLLRTPFLLNRDSRIRNQMSIKKCNVSPLDSKTIWCCDYSCFLLVRGIVSRTKSEANGENSGHVGRLSHCWEEIIVRWSWHVIQYLLILARPETTIAGHFDDSNCFFMSSNRKLCH